MTLKSLALVIGLMFCTGSAFAASLCTAGSLDNYLALGPDGCTIGGVTFSGFSSMSSVTGATPIASSAIMVTPITTNFDPGLDFGLSVSSVSQLSEDLVLYNVSGGQFTGDTESISNYSFTVDGAVTAVENTCAGGQFSPGTVTGCSGNPDALIAEATDGYTMSTDSRTFGPVASINVGTDFLVDGGTAGTASLGHVTNQFNNVPEPGTSGLVALGLIAASRARHLAMRKKQS